MLEGIFSIIKGARIRDRLVEGNRAAYMFDLITAEESRVKRIMPFYNPSPITNAEKK